MDIQNTQQSSQEQEVVGTLDKVSWLVIVAM